MFTKPKAIISISILFMIATPTVYAGQIAQIPAGDTSCSLTNGQIICRGTSEPILTFHLTMPPGMQKATSCVPVDPGSLNCTYASSNPSVAPVTSKFYIPQGDVPHVNTNQCSLKDPQTLVCSSLVTLNYQNCVEQGDNFYCN